MTYLLTARQCEIGELERLARTSDLVNAAGHFIHALQRERGTSNIYLASHGERFAAMRLEQIAPCDHTRALVLSRFEALAAEAATVRNGARLFNRIAVVVDGLEDLPSMRDRIESRTVSPAEAIAAYTRLIASLLAMVFEAADSAGDPEISRALVAMFHFMQGKEYAGQERALGGAVFTRGHTDAAGQQQWRCLIEQQHRCLDVFREFADPEVAAAEQRTQDPGVVVQIERLRRIGYSPGANAPDESMVDAWYECCTARRDAMRRVEDLLAGRLKALCERKIGEACDALRDQGAALARQHRDSGVRATAPTLIGPQLERSVIDMVNDQSRRLQSMQDELETVRSALNERKLIERA